MKNNERQFHVCLVEDDNFFGKLAKKKIEDDKKFRVTHFLSGEAMWKDYDNTYDIFVLDYYLDSTDENARDGKELLKLIKRANPAMPVIMLTSASDIEKAVEFLKCGATDYVLKTKDFHEKLTHTLNRVTEVTEIKEEYGHLKKTMQRDRSRLAITFGILLGILIIALLF